MRPVWPVDRLVSPACRPAGARGDLLRRIGLMVALGLVALMLLWPREPRFAPVDPVPGYAGDGRLELREGQMVLHLAGEARQRGWQHGRLLPNSVRMMVDGYLNAAVCGRSEDTRRRLIARVRVVKTGLPDWYLAELSACAAAAGVDEEDLLLSQCEGDVASLSTPTEAVRTACSAYIVFGRAHIAHGQMLVGRNFDYVAGPFIHHCVLTTYVVPRRGDGHAFVAVGWAGILGGWTLVNSRGLVIANHLGGGPRTNAYGVPTLILTRTLAQRASTIDEALAIMRRMPRMRGQIVWLAQPADRASRRMARAVAVEYDARALFVREAQKGMLIVSNQNRVFGGRPQDSSPARQDSVHADLARAIEQYRRAGPRLITATARPNTLHAVEVDFDRGCLFVAHGCLPAQSGRFVEYPLPRDGQ